MKNIIRITFLGITIIYFIVFNMQAQSLLAYSEITDPKEIGEKLANRLLETPHLLNNGTIHYAEVGTWLGALRYAKISENKELFKRLQQRFDKLFDSEKSMLPTKHHVDFNMFGSLPLELYNMTGDNKYLELGLPYADSQWILPDTASQEEKAYDLKGYTWQTRLWIDDMYMITVVQDEAYLATGDKKYIDRAAKEMVYYLEQLQRPNGLFYHAPDVPYYWARGDGWMAVGMANILQDLPESHPKKNTIMKGYLKMMDSLKQYQGKDGMWKQLINESDFWSETSGTAMFTYAMIRGVQKGWLPKAEYTPLIQKAWNAMVTYINPDGDVREVCIGTGKYNDKKYYYDRPRIVGDYHGQAPYLWCAAALLEK